MSHRFCLLRQAQRLEAAAGPVRAAWDQAAGGALKLCAGSLTVAVEAEVDGSLGGGAVLLRQREDRAPRLLPLGEGPARVGVRALYGLYDEDGRLQGDGMQETWVTRHGEVFLAFGLRLVPQAGLTVAFARVRCAIGGLAQPLLREGTRITGSGGDGAVALAGSKGTGRRFDTLLWRSTRPPFYERWPTFFDQWSLAPDSFGWDQITLAGDAVEFGWRRENSSTRSLDLRGLAWCGFGAERRTVGLLDAHERPVDPRVLRGTLRCYDELDGAFEVAADEHGGCELELPADPAERPVRVRVYGLGGRGGYVVEPAGSAQFSSGDSRTDDPLVAVPVEADRPADEALYDLVGRPDGPTRIVLEPRRTGIHLAYQRRDPQRRITVHHPGDPERAICAVDLAGVRLRGLRLPGARRAALHDLPLYWMRYLAKASAHSANRLEQVEILEDGPECVALRLSSSTPDGLVQSSYELAFPYAEDRVEVRIRACLAGASTWNLPTFEYADLFPADGIAPSDWDYSRIAFVGADSTRVLDPRDPYPSLGERIAVPAPVLHAMQIAHAIPGAGPWSFAERAAIVLHGSESGTILALATNPEPGAGVEHVVTLCEHWMDIHLDVAAAGRRPISSEAEAATAPGPEGPDALVAKLRLQLLDPRLPFDEVVASAQSLVGAGGATIDQ